MTERDYNAWAKHHATVFGFATEADLSMLASWYEVLGVHNIDDMREATRRMASGIHPKWPREHLSSITAQIRGLRAERFENDSQAVNDPDRGSCVRCRGIGRVSVPHPRCLDGDEWVPRVMTRSGCAIYYECSVYCTCRLGMWFHQHGPEGLTLERYELVNPRWEWQMAKVHGMDREVAERSSLPRHANLEATLKRLAERFRIGGKR